MSQKVMAILVAVMVIFAASTAVMSSTGASADKGGCPTAHANDKAKNKPHKDCPTVTPVVTPEPTPSPTPEPTPSPTPEPTPSPTPEPTPVPSTDTKVVSMVVNAPASGTTGVSFLVSGTANLHNNGPAAGILVDTTFTLVLPSGCTSPNALTATVFNRNLPASIPVQVTRSWNVVCGSVDEHTFTVNGATVISPGQAFVEANTANNSGAGSDMTTVAAPTPTPTPTP